MEQTADANKTKTISIDRGDEEYVFVDKYGEAFCTLRFNPADTGIAKRYKDVLVNIEKKSNEAGADFDVLEADEFLRGQFAYLLGRENAGGAFDTTSPMAVIADGRFFFSVVLETISKIISDALDERYEKVREKIKSAVDEILSAENENK